MGRILNHPKVWKTMVVGNPILGTPQTENFKSLFALQQRTTLRQASKMFDNGCQHCGVLTYLFSVKGFPGTHLCHFAGCGSMAKIPGWIANLPPRCAQQLWPPCCQVGRCSRQLPLLEPNGLHFLLESKQCTIPIFQDGFDINVFQSHYRGSNPII